MVGDYFRSGVEKAHISALLSVSRCVCLTEITEEALLVAGWIQKS